jgi:hypothetical protein
VRLISVSTQILIDRGEMPRRTSLMEFFIKDASDPVHDPENPLRPQANHFRNRMKLGLLVAYWLSCCSHGVSVSRSHFQCTCVCVCGKFARFVRLDRDGVLVTRRFNYITDSLLLFALCRCCLSPAGMRLVCLISYSDSIKQIRDIEQGSRDDNPWDHSWANPEIQTYRQ